MNWVRVITIVVLFLQIGVLIPLVEDDYLIHMIMHLRATESTHGILVALNYSRTFLYVV